jgi:hypothetical protein
MVTADVVEDHDDDAIRGADRRDGGGRLGDRPQRGMRQEALHARPDRGVEADGIGFQMRAVLNDPPVTEVT